MSIKTILKGIPDLYIDGVRDDTLTLVFRFSVLWQLVECKKLDCDAKPKKLKDHAYKFVKDNGLAANMRAAFEFYRNRYFQAEGHETRLEKLCPERRARDIKKDLTEIHAKAEITDLERLTFVLLVIYRLRNNLFHGVKWNDEIGNQADNFTHANDVLVELLAP